MKVSDIMTRDVISITDDTTVGEVAHLLFDRNLTGMPVIDEKRHVIGIITEYDLMSRQEQLHIPTYLNLLKQFKVAGKAESIRKELDVIQSLRARDLMTSPVVTVSPETNVTEAARLFVEHGINPLPVVDTEGELVGIVSRADIVKLFRGAELASE